MIGYQLDKTTAVSCLDETPRLSPVLFVYVPNALPPNRPGTPMQKC